MDGAPRATLEVHVQRYCRQAKIKTEAIVITDHSPDDSPSEIKVRFDFRFHLKVGYYLFSPVGSVPAQHVKDVNLARKSVIVILDLAQLLDDDVCDVLKERLQVIRIEYMELQYLLDRTVIQARQFGRSMPQGHNLIRVTSDTSFHHMHYFNKQCWSLVLTKKAVDDASESICSICLDDYSNKTEASKLLCGHYFHSDCIGKWVGIRTNCPECRYAWRSEGKLDWLCHPWN